MGMKRMRVSIEMSDGETLEYEITPRVQIEFEREYKVPLMKVELMEHIYWLGWRSQIAAKATTLTFEEWIDNIAGVKRSSAPAPLAPPDLPNG